MIDLVKYTNTELMEIVGIIPTIIIKKFLNQNPKTLNRIKPGFRASSIPSNQCCKLLVKAIENGDKSVPLFVSSILEKEISKICEKEEENNIESLIIKLADSLFSEHIRVYYKIADIDIDNGNLEQLQTMVTMLKSWRTHDEENKKRIVELSKEKDEGVSEISELTIQNRKLREEISELKSNLIEISGNNTKKEQEMQQLVKQIKDNKMLLQVYEDNLAKKNQEIKKLTEQLNNCKIDLNNKITSLSEFDNTVQVLQEEIKSSTQALDELRVESVKKDAEIAALKTTIEELNTTLSKDEKDTSISSGCEIGKGSRENIIYYKYRDCDEFRDEINDRLDKIGVSDHRELISSFIERITYLRYPIVGERSDCNLLVKLISSIITEGDYTHLLFSEDINVSQIVQALESAGRIIYFDNFIGNYNETILLPILQKYDDKIIIVSAMYSKMFRYLPEELLAYCTFVSFSHEHFKNISNWDDYCIEEVPTERLRNKVPNAATTVLEGIVRDLKFPEIVCEVVTCEIDNHTYLNSVLLYELLPYMINVLGLNPFDMSERLLNYTQKSKYRTLIEKWFINE